jgi:polyphosphate kinase
MSPAEQLAAIRERVSELLRDAHVCFRDEIVPALAEKDIQIIRYGQLSDGQRALADAYFHEIVFPVLTPLAFDTGRPFPHISNLSLNLAILIRDQDGVERFARLKVPDTLPQLVTVSPRGSARLCLVWLEQVISANLGALFPGMQVVEAHPFHVTRNADVAIQELEAADLLETIEEGIRARRFATVVRLKVDREMPEEMLKLLIDNLEGEEEVFRLEGPLGLSRLRFLTGLDRPDLKDAPFQPTIHPSLEPGSEAEEMFAAIRRQDVLLHHPFDSFQPVVDFLQKAARDPNVLAIKMTLYRIGRNSPVVEALLEALENGKQVAVLVELKARFDEESNIEWARALEREGVHVVYGLVGLKIHSKVTLVVRREGERIRRYVHLATGNYNPVTAHLYTDLGLFTADESIGADATDLFNYLTGYSAKNDYRKLLVAPINLRQRFRGLIEREIEHQKAGRPAHLIFKLNALQDREMIELLYQASQAGVRCDLLVRGICCLRPQVPGISDHIRVTSIVGRFLEHSRLFYFKNGGAEEVYLGSADLMTRNIDRRVETITPVEDRRLVRMLRQEILATYLADNTQARVMQPDGSYVRLTPQRGEKSVHAQAWLLNRALSRRRD